MFSFALLAVVSTTSVLSSSVGESIPRRVSFHHRLVLLVCRGVSVLGWVVSYTIHAKYKGLTARKLPSNLYHVVP
jgi:hypothetical protein